MRVLIIGLGSIAMKHIDALQLLCNDVDFFALRRKESNSSYEKVEDIYVLEDDFIESIDFIIISNPTNEHHETLVKLKKFNKPLFVEKPLFDKIDSKSTELVFDIVSRGIKTYVACNLRFLECITELNNLLKNERINEVNVYCGSYLPDWRSNVDYRKVYSANKEMGGGVHIDLIHELDYVYWLFGKPIATSSIFQSKSSLDITAYDYANYIWSYNDFTASIILNYYRRDSKRTIEVVTSNGTYIADLLCNSIQFNGELIFENKNRIKDTYRKQMEFFLNEIVLKDKEFNTIVEANEILKLCIED